MTADLGWLKEMADDEIIAGLVTTRPDTPAAEQLKAEMQFRIARRHILATEALILTAEASAKLAERVWWLNIALLALTVVALSLALLQVLIALGLISPIANVPTTGGV